MTYHFRTVGDLDRRFFGCIQMAATGPAKRVVAKCWIDALRNQYHRVFVDPNTDNQTRERRKVFLKFVRRRVLTMTRAEFKFRRDCDELLGRTLRK